MARWQRVRGSLAFEVSTNLDHWYDDHTLALPQRLRKRLFMLLIPRHTAHIQVLSAAVRLGVNERG